MTLWNPDLVRYKIFKATAHILKMFLYILYLTITIYHTVATTKLYTT